MKLIVAGSRTFQDYTLLSSVLGTHRHHITELLHGGARGDDRLAFRWAVRHHVRSRCMRQLGKPVVVIRTDTTA
jgi:hypothetical protein